jgi:hypothetical protein
LEKNIMETPTPGFAPQPLPAEPKSNRTGIIIAVILVVLCCCCLIASISGYALWTNGDEWFGTGALLPALAAL